MEVKHLKLDEHLFEKALRRKLSDETVQVLEIKNNPISDKGLNFLSDLFEVSVRYTVTSKKEKTKSERSTDVFIKIEPLNDVPRDLVRQQDLFLTELRVLRDVLPKIKQLMSCQLGPYLWYGSDNPPVLIMEDLKNRGFIMKNRQKGLPFEHCSLAIQKIAKLHAGSVAVFEKVNKYPEIFF